MLSLIKKMPDFLTDIIVILLISLITGFSVNYFGHNKISFDESVTNQIIKEKFQFITLKEAKNRFDHHNTVFVDARDNEDYLKGHIKDSFNLPAHHANDNAPDFLEAYPDKEKFIIIYCDGNECDLSSDIYKYLATFGYKNLYILTNGWSLWKEHHYPVTENSKKTQDKHLVH